MEGQAARNRALEGAGFGIPDPSTLLRLSGMEAMVAAVSGELPAAPMEAAMSYRLIEAEKGRVLHQGSPSNDYRNPAGTIHGGWIATMLDSCMTGAIYTLLEPHRGYSTIEMSVNFIKPVTTKVRALRAEGKVIHSGRQLATAEGRLYGPGNVLFAHAKTTCYLFDVPAR